MTAQSLPAQNSGPPTAADSGVPSTGLFPPIAQFGGPTSVSGQLAEDNDVAGIRISFGKLADGALRDQFTSEAFYRFQLTEFLAITPDV
jgi:hypothetical protein